MSLISARHPRIAVNIAGLTSYVTLVVKLFEDLSLHHTFDAVDQSTMIATVVGIVYVLLVVSGVNVDGAAPAPLESVMEPARDAAGTQSHPAIGIG